jgi:hypothetical protein
MLWPNGIYFVVIWYIFPRLGRVYREKSGNPVPEIRTVVDL